MPGAESLGGLVYQQRYVNYRVQSQLALSMTIPSAQSETLLKFSVEGRSGTSGPIWDIVFETSDGMIDLHECKDTAITKEDRLTFYDRLRGQIASGTLAERIRPVWVTDPDKQTPNALRYLEGMPAALQCLEPSSVPSVPPNRMNNTNDALNEAIHRLCHFSGQHAEEGTGEKKKSEKKEWPRPCTLHEATVLLGNIRIARHRFEELDKAIALLATGLFSSGTPASINTFVTGVLTDRVATDGKAEFTVDEFIQAIGTLSLEQTVVGAVRELIATGTSSEIQSNVRLITWRNLPDAPTTSWTLSERIPGYKSGHSSCLVADMGGGKTVASQLAFLEESQHKYSGRILRFEARALDQSQLNALQRLACMFCGVGPTWIAIDGLDEVSHELRVLWTQALSRFASLPNLALFVTVRREVLTVQEWLTKAVDAIPRVDLSAISSTQIRSAFSDAGLPAPANDRLVEVLQNPFLLSLYASVVQPDDMPLAESGEVTAFVVIEEFWNRRVRGISLGQRAVKDSEISQEPKRRAALYLGEKSLAGELAIQRSSDDQQIVAGIEMLLREGVIREQGISAVAWIHEWLREFAIVETLRSRVATADAVSLARRILTDCPVDHVARSAATGGIKWVMAHTSSGDSNDFLTELAKENAGLAREGLIVLLEGAYSSGVLAKLPDGLLCDALTLAVTLGVPHWADEIARLDESRFFGEHGDRLHRVAVDYELRVAPSENDAFKDVVRRVAERDLKRLTENRPLSGATFSLILEKIVQSGAYRDPGVVDWLVRAGGMAGYFYLGRMRDAIAKLFDEGASDVAHGVYRATIGLNDQERGDQVAQSLVNRRITHETDLLSLLDTPSLISAQSSTWGATGIELLSKLVEASQRKAWPSRHRFAVSVAQHLGTAIPTDDSFREDYDEDPRITTLDEDSDSAIVRTRLAIEQGFLELARLDEPNSFGRLADSAIEARFAAVIAIPLLVLQDVTNDYGSHRAWHQSEMVRLLTIHHVSSLASLNEIRRLLRRQSADTFKPEVKEELARAVRLADLPDGVRLRELSDFDTWSVLTKEEIERIQQLNDEWKIQEPLDPRQDPPFGQEISPPTEDHVSSSNWPHPEDEGSIRLLEALISQPNRKFDPENDDWIRYAAALESVIARPEASTDDWLGEVLAWSRALVWSLREFAQSDANSRGERLTTQRWKEVIDQYAPWWPKIINAALNRLKGAVPEHHSKQRNGEMLSWGSGDPIHEAAGILNNVLLIDPTSPFDLLQVQLVENIVSKWDDWPAFTKATILSSLQPWFFARYARLREILSKSLKSEKDPLVVRYATNRAIQIARTIPVPELSDFLERAKFGQYKTSVGDVATLLGNAAIIEESSATDKSDIGLGMLLRKGLDLDWQYKDTNGVFLRGVLYGGRDAVRQTENSGRRANDSWLELVHSVTEHWKAASESEDGQEYALQAICSVVEDEKSAEERTRLFLGLANVYEVILSRGRLDEYCRLHFHLKDLLTGRRSTDVRQAGTKTFEVSDAVETALLSLCRASVNRVLAWHRAGRTTDDMGWYSGLIGQDSVELIKLCLSMATDRQSFMRDVRPLVDVLAAAGQPGLAAELLIFLRTV